MTEFGSDFHYCAVNDFSFENELSKYDALFYAIGRHTLHDIIGHNSWKRIWIPSYFCYEIIDAIKETGIIIKLYPDAPTFDDNSIISRIHFEENDVLLRMNYFGLRTLRDNSKLSVSVIEDHSHDLIGDWASNSNADWCFASLRKTLPLPEGGILWSPKHLNLPPKLKSTIENDLISYKRLSAMLLKTLYLADFPIHKDVYRQLYIETEDAFSIMEISSISKSCFSLLQHFNIQEWYRKKKINWVVLSTISNENICILNPENIKKCNPFSLIIQFKNNAVREYFIKISIQNQIYPAILWNIPVQSNSEIVLLGETLLSVHCDARYELAEIESLKSKLIDIITTFEKNQ